MVDIVVNGQFVSVPDGATMLDACKQAGAKVPTLCYLPKVNCSGSCRMCVVEVEGESRLAAACNTPAANGMSVLTSTPRVVAARRANMQMLLSEHRSNCTSCKRNGTCELQSLASDLGMASEPYGSGLHAQPGLNSVWDPAFPLVRDSSKCIKCMRCVSECAKVQHCGVWDFTGSGSHMKVCVHDGEPIADAGCALCGQCITHCPTGALSERDDVDRVLAALADPDVLTVVQVAPAVRTSWCEDMGISREDATPGRLASALRAIGFDRVFDTDFAADLTIMEEANEFLEWISEGKPRPMFTSCCPGWVRFAKLHYPEFISQLSSCKSPHQMLGALVKNTIPGSAPELQGKRVFCLSVMPCLAKKYEAAVPQLSTDAGADVDAVLTVRELTRMLRMFAVDCANLEETPFDDPLGKSTGAGTIFGRTGGVMEAALRTAAFLLTGKNPSFADCDTTAATPEHPWVVKEVSIGDVALRIGISSGLENTSLLLDALSSGDESLDFVEVMACPGGCVGGGGQPIRSGVELAGRRAAVLNSLDAADSLRCSHENPDVQLLYDDLLGKPLGHLSEEWLHTDQASWDI